MPPPPLRFAAHCDIAFASIAQNICFKKCGCLLLGVHYPIRMSLCDAPAVPALSCAGDSAPDDASAWGIAAAIAYQVVSSTVTSQRQAAKESLRVHLKSIAPLEWPSMCAQALRWIAAQAQPARGGSGLVAAAIALVEEDSCRRSIFIPPPPDSELPSANAAAVDGTGSSPTSASLSLSVARQV